VSLSILIYWVVWSLYISSSFGFFSTFSNTNIYGLGNNFYFLDSSDSIDSNQRGNFFVVIL